MTDAHLPPHDPHPERPSASEWLALARERLVHLYPAERQMLDYLLDDYPPREIAVLLHLSSRTIENRISRLFQALDVKSERDVISLAVACGLQRGYRGLHWPKAPPS